MSDIAIKVENLSKSYLVGHQAQPRERYTALRDVIVRNAKSLARKTRDIVQGRPIVLGDDVEEFWALKDINFEIKQGDRVGIIGRNGAGKSTLLKILSRITEPTTGRVTLNGRVASLLEVGTGFHPELTGRENIYLNGAILGMSRKEIQRKFDEIVEFAEVEKFLDTPVKRYSSGMYVRLAFAVAAHLEPEILLVDEVLAVGDAEFQRKCLGKMEEVGDEGRSVVFVSHNMAAVQKLCSRGVFLSRGRVEYVGTQAETITRYLSAGTGPSISLANRRDRNGTQEVRVNSIVFVDSNGHPVTSTASGHELRVRLHFEQITDRDCRNIIAGVAVRSVFDVPVFLQHNRLTGDQFGTLPKLGYFELRVPRLPLPPSTYRLGFSLIKDGVYLDAVADAAELNVIAGDFFQSGEVPPASHGLCLVGGTWSLQPAGWPATKDSV